ncbi:hypothetical protein F4803DRAFT_570300 [Xylaria telfairii]|nr:hypothetical protein F4803DRAFT_570300 [Xylaria telfairii]
MSYTVAEKKAKKLAPLSTGRVGNTLPTQHSNIDSAVDMTFPESVKDGLNQFDHSDNELETKSPKISTPLSNHVIDHHTTSACSAVNSGAPDTPRTSLNVVDGMPYTSEHLMEMGKALAQARREKNFPPTITPSYNIKAIIDDYEDLERLNAAREGVKDARDHAFSPGISRLYIEIQRKIQDRDLTYGEVAAENNVRARLSGFANGTGAETGMYNLMRHATNSVLRLNNLTLDSKNNIVDAVASRVVNDIRATVKSQAACGANGVTGQNMDAVMEEVFSAIQDALSQGVGTQANRLDGQINNMSNIASNITDAHKAQVNAIAVHVNAIDSHVHAMGNNVSAMSSLVNSTNGNVTALTTNVGSLQTVVNMIPQMASNAVRDMLRDMLPGIIGPAVEKAFEAAISNELIARMQVFANAVQEARARAEAINNPHYRTSEKRSKRSWFSIFKRRSGRRSGQAGTTY